MRLRRVKDPVKLHDDPRWFLDVTYRREKSGTQLVVEDRREIQRGPSRAGGAFRMTVLRSGETATRRAPPVRAPSYPRQASSADNSSRMVAGVSSPMLERRKVLPFSLPYPPSMMNPRSFTFLASSATSIPLWLAMQVSDLE